LLAPSRVFFFSSILWFWKFIITMRKLPKKKTLAPSPTCFFRFHGWLKWKCYSILGECKFLKLLSWECIKFWNLFFLAMGQSMRSITKRKFWTLDATPPPFSKSKVQKLWTLGWCKNVEPFILKKLGYILELPKDMWLVRWMYLACTLLCCWWF
jgi:hypothetical protein